MTGASIIVLVNKGRKMKNFVQFFENLRNRPLFRLFGMLGIALAGAIYWLDAGNRFLLWLDPPPIRAALTDFSEANGQVNAALTVEAEALVGSYAWVCAPTGARPVDVLPIARSTALRFSVPSGAVQTFVYLQLAGGSLLEVSVDLYTGGASDAAIITEEEQQCG